MRLRLPAVRSIVLCLAPCFALFLPVEIPARAADPVRATDPVPAAQAEPEYQWAVPVTRPDGKVLTAYVWIPPGAQRIRGVVIGGDPSLSAIAGDASLRSACRDEHLALVGVRPHFDAIFDYAKGDGPATFLKVLDEVGRATGYEEIAVAPFFAFGHSVSCNYATAAACWARERCFGILVFKGGLVMPAYDPDADISGVPILAIKGQYEEFGPGPSGALRDFEDREASWRNARQKIQALRETNERVLASLLVEAGATHMAWSPRNGEYVGLFLRKAVRARIPDWPVGQREPVKCREIDPKSGALTTTAVGTLSAPSAAPHAEFKGNRKWSWWHMDLELAQAWDAFHAGRFGKRAQFVAFADPDTGQPIPSRHDLRLSVEPRFVGPDTFKLAATFLDAPRDKYPAPEPPVGHAPGPIRFRVFGPDGIRQIGPDTFQVRLNGRGSSAGSTGSAVLAYHPGDETYRHAEQPAAVKPAPVADGKPNAVTFPPLPERVSAKGPPVRLGATSESGLPVAYFVQAGPAVIEEGKLRITGIPPRAKYPLKVTVGAYQWGSAVEPRVRTAEPVAQTVLVEE